MSQYERQLYKLHAELCKTLANPTRLQILNLLRDGELSVTEITARTGIRQTTISQHLALLRQRDVVSVRKEGLKSFYRVSNPKMIQACDLIRDVLFDTIAEMDQLAKTVDAR